MSCVGDGPLGFNKKARHSFGGPSGDAPYKVIGTNTRLPESQRATVVAE
jgi:hypothetical protein